jgi:hypothetical protein
MDLVRLGSTQIGLNENSCPDYTRKSRYSSGKKTLASEQVQRRCSEKIKASIEMFHKDREDDMPLKRSFEQGHVIESQIF